MCNPQPAILPPSAHATADAGSGPFAHFRSSASRPIVGNLRDAQVTFARVGLGRHHDRLDVAFEPQDAWFAIFQLRDAPSHAHWKGNRAVPAPAVRKGSLHIVNLQDDHSARLEGVFDSLNILIPRAYVEQLADDAGSSTVRDLSVPAAWTTQDAVIGGLEELLLIAIHDDEPLGPLLIDNLAATVVTHIAERYGDLARVVARSGILAPWQARRSKEMIAENLTNEVSLASVAAECRLSLTHFSRAFKATVGDTPHGWLQRSRTAKAKELLAGPAALAEIALTCGFADQSHFSRMFKRATGLTPGVWRRTR